jgi:hypothetical protein
MERLLLTGARIESFIKISLIVSKEQVFSRKQVSDDSKDSDLSSLIGHIQGYKFAFVFNCECDGFAKS